MQTTATITTAPRASSTVLLHVLLAVGAACTLNGCANYSQVISEDADGSYNLTATGISYTMSMPALTAASHEKAVSWCAAQDGDLQLRQQTRGWKPMQVELNFRCLPKQVGQLDQSASLPNSLPNSLQNSLPTSLPVFK